MIPNVFISSTIADLHHLREALKDTVEELMYRPLLSEFGDIGYLPHSSTEISCYLSMKDCQIAILIIGKRYGSISDNKNSITHNEFLTARDSKIPVICLVDREVISFKKLYDLNDENTVIPEFPGMDNPKKTFELIQNIMDSNINNGILKFSSVSDARSLIKTQLAHIFGDLLWSKYDPIKAEVKDVLSEVKTLREELKNKDFDPQPFIKAVRLLLDDRYEQLRNLFERISGTIERAVPFILEQKKFEDYLVETNIEFEVDDSNIDINSLSKDNELVTFTRFVFPQGYGHPESPRKSGQWGMLRGNKVIMSSSAKLLFDYSYEEIRKKSGV
jgi:hypothetical protein